MTHIFVMQKLLQVLNYFFNLLIYLFNHHIYTYVFYTYVHYAGIG